MAAGLQHFGTVISMAVPIANYTDFPMQKIFSSVFLLLIILSTCSCAAKTPGSYIREDLANQGPVALSKDNPYVAANLLLSREAENSEFVRGFIKFRGTPDAIEVKKKLLKPSRIYFFYLDKAEAYLLSQKDQEWIIRGPERIPEPIQSRLNLIVSGGPSGEMTQPTKVEPPPTLFGEEIIAPEPRLAPAPLLNSPNSLPPARGTRELTDSGDITHNVTYPGETLRMIASWYTGSAENTKRIARINGITTPDLLVIGQAVRIPRYLMKRSDPLPQSEVERYINSLSAPTR